MLQVVIEKGDSCTLYDNSGRVKWRVKSPRGQEGLVPGKSNHLHYKICV